MKSIAIAEAARNYIKSNTVGLNIVTTAKEIAAAAGRKTVSVTDVKAAEAKIHLPPAVEKPAPVEPAAPAEPIIPEKVLVADADKTAGKVKTVKPAQPEVKPAKKAPADDKVKVELDWAFRRLRNQAALYFSKGDRDNKRELMERLENAANYTELRENLLAVGKIDDSAWEKFMNHFFGHTITKAI